MIGLQPFFCFYGGKWRAATRYPAPMHAGIVEPFAGAAGYATRYSDRAIVLIERDPTIAALWRYLCRVSAAEILSIPILRGDEGVDDLHVCSEARSLVGFWLNKGSATPKRSQSAWMRAGIRPKSFWGIEIRARIAAQVDRIRHWQIVEGSYEAAPDIKATWFIDSPYANLAGQRYRFHEIDYEVLSTWVRQRHGQTIVCEQVGASWLPFQPFARLKANESRTGGRVTHEAIWLGNSP